MRKRSTIFAERKKDITIQTGEIASPAGDMGLGVCLRLGCVLGIKCLQAFFHTGVIDSQELVLRSGHVDKIRACLRHASCSGTGTPVRLWELFSGMYRLFGRAFSADVESRASWSDYSWKHAFRTRQRLD